MEATRCRRNAARLISVWTVAVGAVLVIGPSRAQPASAQQVTFTKDIAPILQRSCQVCHRTDGGFAPMSLVTYEEVRPWARALKWRTARREMPPWYIEKNVGIQHFTDDPSLSDDEIETIARWADAGAPRGSPADLPPPVQFTDASVWAIGGEPDLVVKGPVVTVAAFGADQYPPVLGEFPTGLTEDRWIKAFQVREVWLNEAPSTTKQSAEGESSGGEYTFVWHHQVIADQPEGNRGGFQLTHEVGQNEQYIPDDLGVPLKAGSSIYFNSGHFFSIGKEVTAQLEIGFKFYPKGYKPKYPNRWQELPRWGLGQELDIPGNTNVVTHQSIVLEEPRRLLTFEPHLHAGGRRMCLEAVYPDFRRETLNCAGYNHSWVRTYAYEDDYAPLLPTGTVLHFTAWYDNTAGNPLVADPRNWRGLGMRSIDEMFLFKGKTVLLTEEEYQAEVAARRDARLSK